MIETCTECSQDFITEADFESFEHSPTVDTIDNLARDMIAETRKGLWEILSFKNDPERISKVCNRLLKGGVQYARNHF